MRKDLVGKGKSWHLMWVAILTTWSALAVVAQEASDTEPVPKGVVIEEVGEGSALEKAGLQPGDVVWAWERPSNPSANPKAARGEIRSVFDWMWLKWEQAPRGTVRLFGEREGVERLFEVKLGKWDGRVRPCLQGWVLEVYLQGLEKVEAGEIKHGVEIWNQLIKFGAADSGKRLRSWIHLCIGEAYAETKVWDQAIEAYLTALEEVGAQGEDPNSDRSLGITTRNDRSFCSA